MTARPGSWGWTALLGLLAVTWAGFFFLHPEKLEPVGIGHYRIELAPQQYREIWFLDTFAILASNDAATAGRDPYAANPLDYMRRPHVYGPWWLQLRHLGLTRAHVRGIGFTLGGLFLAVAVALLRPRSAGALLWSAAVLCCTPVLVALERANNDLVVFLLLAAVGPCVLSRSTILRWSAVALVALAAELKIYPAVVGVVLLAGGDLEERRQRVVVAGVVLAMVAVHLAVSIVPLTTVLPPLRGAFNFGAEIALREFGVKGSALRWISLVIGGAFFAFAWRMRLMRGWQPVAGHRGAWLQFIMASVVLCGCFFTGQHFAYRWIFAVALAPFLWIAMTSAESPVTLRPLARLTSGLLLAQLWVEALAVIAWHGRPSTDLDGALTRVWLALQPVTWTLVGCLLIFLAHFVRENLAELLPRRRALEQGGPVAE